jgi:hypothetical protein
MFLVKSFPDGEFEDISIEMTDWQEKFKSQIKDRKRIKFDLFQMPTISKEIQEELGKQSYGQLILESNHDQRLLIPISN